MSGHARAQRPLNRRKGSRSVGRGSRCLPGSRFPGIGFKPPPRVSADGFSNERGRIMAKQLTAQRRANEQKNHVHVGLPWLVAGLATMALFLGAISLGTHQDLGTLSPIWFVVLIGAVMTVFGIIAMSKRRHTGDSH